MPDHRIDHHRVPNHMRFKGQMGAKGLRTVHKVGAGLRGDCRLTPECLVRLRLFLG